MIQKMKCPFCDTDFEMETLANYDSELKNKPEDDMRWENAAGKQWQDSDLDSVCSYVCHSCGGEIACDKNTAATSCPFCGNTVVMLGNFSGALKPDCVIPFKLNKKDAESALKKHYDGKRLLPKVFKSGNHISEVKGIYVPFWLFDAGADVGMHYKATKVRTWSDSDYNYAETSFFAVSRGGSIEFESVPVDGSAMMPDDLMESLEPFHVSEAVDFQTAYLAGYLAEKYDVDAEQSAPRANERIKKSAESAFEATVNGYTTVTKDAGSVQLQNGKVKYAFSYLIWLL